MGGDRIKYPGNIRTPTVALTTSSMVINRTISTPRARYMCGNLGKFYLVNLLDCYEHTRLSINISPQQIIDAYNLLGIFHNGYLYCEIQQGMYGIPQAGKLAYNQLFCQLNPHGYAPCRHMSVLWRSK